MARRTRLGAYACDGGQCAVALAVVWCSGEIRESRGRRGVWAGWLPNENARLYGRLQDKCVAKSWPDVSFSPT